MRLLQFANVLLALPWSLAILAIHYRVLRKAQVVVVMRSPSGFGHTITGPDAARRLFPGQRCVFIIVSQNPAQNWEVASIWPDVKVIFLPMHINRKMRAIDWHIQFSWQFLDKFIRQAAGPGVLIPNIRELYGRIPIPETLRKSLDHLLPNSRWPLGYFLLQQRVAAPSARLPLRRRNAIRSQLNHLLQPANNGGQKRLCGLYLRQKGAGSGNITESRRVGSPLEDYLPAIGLLNEASYQVLLTGDVGIPISTYAEFKGMLVDAHNLKKSKKFFDLFAATEADIFIGEAGGGMHLPGVNGIPRLVVNSFPYYQALPHSWIYYKAVRDGSGNLVDYRKLFTEHAYDYELPGMTVHNNTMEEIYEAVSSFLGDVARNDETDPNADVISQLPDDLWVKHANARLSPAWLRLYEQG